MLVLKNIAKDYLAGDSKVSALKDVNIEFRKNEFVSILGPSGCGKTTMLNIIGGLDRYTKGDLLINGNQQKNLMIMIGIHIETILLDLYFKIIILFHIRQYSLMSSLRLRFPVFLSKKEKNAQLKHWKRWVLQIRLTKNLIKCQADRCKGSQ